MTIMKYRNILSIGMALAMTLVFTACSQEENLTASQETVKAQNGYYVYKIDFNCEAPAFEQQDGTRAVSYSWQNGETLFARFKSGSNYYAGFIVCEGNDGWSLVSKTSFLETAASGTCELYFYRMNEDYYLCPNLDTEKFDLYRNGVYVESTGVALDASTIGVTFMTSFYYTTSGTFKKTGGTSGNWGVTATLSPGLWRMRFKGTDNTTVTLPASDNDIQYCSVFNWTFSTPSVSPTFSMSAQDVNLTVSGGYTPYVYGLFSSNGSNKITVQNGNVTYTRNISASSLPIGTSGYFDIPTESNYSNYGWTKTIDTSPITGTDWTWDYDGVNAIWGNMGYCGGSGEDVGVNHYGQWWGVTNEAGFYEQLAHTNDGKAHGDESMNAYFTLGNDGRIGRYSGNGTEINRGTYSFDYSVADNWKVANLNTTPGTILWPYEINSGGNMPSVFEVVYMTQSRLCLVYPDEGNFSSLGSWGEATFWHFKKVGSNPVSQLFEEPYLNWGASKSTVKSNRSSNGYTLRSESDDILYYEPKYKEKYSEYMFNTGGLYISSVDFESSTISFSELVDYVRTTLGAVYDYTAESGTMWFNAKDGKSRIFVMTYSSGNVGVNYTQSYSSSPAYLSNHIMPKEMDRHLESVSSKMVQQATKEYPEVHD